MVGKKHKHIPYTDISVVVQGPIVGKPEDSHDERLTWHCLQSIRKYLPGAHIILSTWKGSDVRDLEYDTLVESVDPGYTYLRYFGDVALYPDSSNRQIVSTIAGLQQCHTTYAIKMRSDLVYRGTGFLQYFSKYVHRARDPKYQVTRQRIAMFTTPNPARRSNFPFTVCDWFFFGRSEDVKDLFDIPHVNEHSLRGEKDVDGYFKLVNNFHTEQYLWIAFLSKYKKIPVRHITDDSKEHIELAEKFFANNAILLPAYKAQINWLKYPWAAYAQVPCLSNTGLYTFTEYRRMLKKYADASVIVLRNIPEDVLYWVVYNLRFWLKKKNTRLHDAICRLVNRRNHERVARNHVKRTSS